MVGPRLAKRTLLVNTLEIRNRSRTSFDSAVVNMGHHAFRSHDKNCLPRFVKGLTEQGVLARSFNYGCSCRSFCVTLDLPRKNLTQHAKMHDRQLIIKETGPALFTSSLAAARGVTQYLLCKPPERVSGWRFMSARQDGTPILKKISETFEGIQDTGICTRLTRCKLIFAGRNLYICRAEEITAPIPFHRS